MRAPIDRRAFLRLATRGRDRVLDLYCERLYMRWANARFGEDRADAPRSGPPSSQPWDGEPATELRGESPDEVLAELDRELSRADAVRVRQTRWLSDPAFRRLVEARLASFRSLGGRVE